MMNTIQRLANSANHLVKARIIQGKKRPIINLDQLLTIFSLPARLCDFTQPWLAFDEGCKVDTAKGELNLFALVA
ncbi:MAG: hypothetical protein HQM06_06765 [Magnetococcales bacterium]|nr:hypothetical protein [Magnetococcales bacterium]